MSARVYDDGPEWDDSPGPRSNTEALHDEAHGIGGTPSCREFGCEAPDGHYHRIENARPGPVMWPRCEYCRDAVPLMQCDSGAVHCDAGACVCACSTCGPEARADVRGEWSR